MEEKIITCIQCDNPFIFTFSEQQRFVARGFDEPKRCRECRKKKVKADMSRREAKMKCRRRQPRHQWEYVLDQ